VLGSPIRHSLSPALHRAGYAALGLTDWRYDAFEVDEAALPGFLAGLDAGWAGLSLTMPLKRVVRPLLARISPLAEQVGAVNTVLVRADGLAGENTDVEGIVTAVREAGTGSVRTGPVRTGHVLGAGATACSAVAALRELGCSKVVVHARHAGRAGELVAAADRLGVRLELAGLEPADLHRAAGADLLISTLPAGAADRLVADLTRADLTRAGLAGGLLLDVVYHPWPTLLAQAWDRAGGGVISGFAMLLHQAAGQFRLMTGHEPPLEQMRAAGLARLGGHADSSG
jgi:shikimate dehydrogenase